MARVGTPKDVNISIPFAASVAASFDGVVTDTAPLNSRSWHMVSWTSPVPGGMSSMRMSRSPQSVPLRLRVKDDTNMSRDKNTKCI